MATLSISRRLLLSMAVVSPSMLEVLSQSPREFELFDLINADRARGYTCSDGTYFPPNPSLLQWDCRLYRSAKRWSQRMADENFCAHRYAGSDSCSRSAAEGYPRLRGCGEVISCGARTAQEANEMLKASTSHCLNMFEPKMKHLGVGYASNPGFEYGEVWTASFGDWHEAPDQSCIGGAPAPQPAPGCGDADTMNCFTYRDQGLCNTPNVRAYCRDTCRIDGCPGTQVTPTTRAPPLPAPGPGQCFDRDVNCAYYKGRGFCGNDHIRQYCSKTCCVCDCCDTDGGCAYYSNNGFCSYDNVRNNCKQTCGVCR